MYHARLYYFVFHLCWDCLCCIFASGCFSVIASDAGGGACCSARDGLATCIQEHMTQVIEMLLTAQKHMIHVRELLKTVHEQITLENVKSEQMVNELRGQQDAKWKEVMDWEGSVPDTTV